MKLSFESMVLILSSTFLSLGAYAAVPESAAAPASGTVPGAVTAPSAGLSAGSVAQSAPAATQAKPAAKKKSTEVSFDEVLVQGKYHFTDEAVTTIEQDKVLDALLGVRTDFKDRMKKSAARH